MVGRDGYAQLPRRDGNIRGIPVVPGMPVLRVRGRRRVWTSDVRQDKASFLERSFLRKWRRRSVILPPFTSVRTCYVQNRIV